VEAGDLVISDLRLSIEDRQCKEFDEGRAFLPVDVASTHLRLALYLALFGKYFFSTDAMIT
jgi:hypothetical protein